MTHKRKIATLGYPEESSIGDFISHMYLIPNLMANIPSSIANTMFVPGLVHFYFIIHWISILPSLRSLNASLPPEHLLCKVGWAQAVLLVQRHRVSFNGRKCI